METYWFLLISLVISKMCMLSIYFKDVCKIWFENALKFKMQVDAWDLLWHSVASSYWWIIVDLGTIAGVPLTLFDESWQYDPPFFEISIEGGLLENQFT